MSTKKKEMPIGVGDVDIYHSGKIPISIVPVKSPGEKKKLNGPIELFLDPVGINSMWDDTANLPIRDGSQSLKVTIKCPKDGWTVQMLSSIIGNPLAKVEDLERYKTRLKIETNKMETRIESLLADKSQTKLIKLNERIKELESQNQKTEEYQLKKSEFTALLESDSDYKKASDELKKVIASQSNLQDRITSGDIEVFESRSSINDMEKFRFGPQYFHNKEQKKEQLSEDLKRFVAGVKIGTASAADTPVLMRHLSGGLVEKDKKENKATGFNPFNLFYVLPHHPSFAEVWKKSNVSELAGGLAKCVIGAFVRDLHVDPCSPNIRTLLIYDDVYSDKDAVKWNTPGSECQLMALAIQEPIATRIGEWWNTKKWQMHMMWAGLLVKPVEIKCICTLQTETIDGKKVKAVVRNPNCPIKCFVSHYKTEKIGGFQVPIEPFIHYLDKSDSKHLPTPGADKPRDDSSSASSKKMDDDKTVHSVVVNGTDVGTSRKRRQTDEKEDLDENGQKNSKKQKTDTDKPLSVSNGTPSSSSSSSSTLSVPITAASVPKSPLLKPQVSPALSATQKSPNNPPPISLLAESKAKKTAAVASSSSSSSSSAAVASVENLPKTQPQTVIATTEFDEEKLTARIQKALLSQMTRQMDSFNLDIVQMKASLVTILSHYESLKASVAKNTDAVKVMSEFDSRIDTQLKGFDKSFKNLTETFTTAATVCMNHSGSSSSSSSSSASKK